MKPLRAFILLIIVSYHSTAQELHIGVHFNPVMTTPLHTQNNAPYADPNLHCPFMAFGDLGLNAGPDVEWTRNKWSILSGFHIISNNLAVTSTDRTNDFQGLEQVAGICNSTSYEWPLLILYQFHEQAKKLHYSVHIALGGSYLYNTITGSESLSYGNFYSPTIDDHFHEVNLAGGILIHAAIHKFGLVEYGFAWYCPVQISSRETYTLTAQKTVDGIYGTYTTGEFHPKLGYLDFRFCYYFLNVGRGWKKIRYY